MLVAMLVAHFDSSIIRFFIKCGLIKQKLYSSSWREIKAVELCLDSFKDNLTGKTVKWFTDSKDSVNIVSCGSTKLHLHEIAISIFSICVKKRYKHRYPVVT